MSNKYLYENLAQLTMCVIKPFIIFILASLMWRSEPVL